MVCFQSTPRLVVALSGFVIAAIRTVVMVALPNIGGAFCSMSQSLADVHYLTAVHRCQDAKAVEIIWGAPNW